MTKICLSHKQGLGRLPPIEDSHCVPHRGLIHVGIPGCHLDGFVTSGLLNDLEAGSRLS
jgi:hypothetical protein